MKSFDDRKKSLMGYAEQTTEVMLNGGALAVARIMGMGFLCIIELLEKIEQNTKPKSGIELEPQTRTKDKK